MLSKVLPVVALSGAALAACPLSVKITGATGHIAEVAVTNTGAEAVTVFKGNTVLSDHATKDVLVANTGIQVSSSQTWSCQEDNSYSPQMVNCSTSREYL